VIILLTSCFYRAWCLISIDSSDKTGYEINMEKQKAKQQIKWCIIVNFPFTDPPGAPFIEGFTPGETLRRGQRVELVCKSRGGNPPAQLIWYKNDAQIRMAYR
jgi:nephron